MEGREESVGEGIMMSGRKREGPARQRGVREVTGEGWEREKEEEERRAMGGNDEGKEKDEFTELNTMKLM